MRLGLATAGYLTLGGMEALAQKPEMATRLTILHTNDVHSHLDPMDSGKYLGWGGAEQRAALIKQIRAREKNVLLLDAGDMFQGTPYFNLFEGEAEAVAMNTIKYDAGTIGNHEFDLGIDRLAEVIRNHFEFPLLNCNYDFSNTPMNGLTREYIIIDKEGLKIGVFGLGIKLDGLVFPGYFAATLYRDPIAEAKRVAEHLRNEENCDFIICLSHINLYEKRRENQEPGDRDLIREVPEIDVVLGGHNHVYLAEPDRYYRKNSLGYVGQTGWAGTHLGYMQFDVYEREKREVSGWSNLPVMA